MKSNYLGIHAYGLGHDAGIAVIDKTGEPVVVLEAERYTKIKKNNSIIPDKLLADVFRYAPMETIVGVGVGQINCAHKAGKSSGCNLDSNREWERIVEKLVCAEKITQFRHHHAHMYSAFYPSGFDRALIITADGNGEFPEAVTVATGDENGCSPLWKDDEKTSLGTLYRVVGALYCGLSGTEGEGKAMALAALGNPVYADKLKSVLCEKGYRLNQPVDITYTEEGDRHLLAMLETAFGPRRPMKDYAPDQPVDSIYADMAASVQLLVETYMLELVETWVRKTGIRKVCLAGGVAMNSAMNGVLLRSGMIDALYVQPASSDNGLALGAAYGALSLDDPLWRKKSHWQQQHCYYGTETDDQAIEKTLRLFDLPVRKVQDPSMAAASRIASEQIVGWFRGRMEYGARALGNRCILADATHPTIKDSMNLKVKNREIWRPFAPAVLRENTGRFFEFERPEPFMTCVYSVQEAFRKILPSITHTDGTARVQSVDRHVNSAFYKVIEAVGKRSGVPVILSTSLNGKGYPIARTPGEAIALFLNSDMDALVLEDYLVEKGDKQKAPAFENDLIAAIVEQTDFKPFDAGFIRNGLPGELSFEQKEMVLRSVKKTGGRWKSPGENARNHMVLLVSGSVDNILNTLEIISGELIQCGYRKFSVLELKQNRVYSRYSGFEELLYPGVPQKQSIDHGSHDMIVLNGKHRFHRLYPPETGKQIVLWPCGAVSGQLARNTSLINGNKILFCVDRDQNRKANGYRTLSPESFRSYLKQNKDSSVDLYLTSEMYAEEILKHVLDWDLKTNIFILDSHFNLYGLAE